MQKVLRNNRVEREFFDDGNRNLRLDVNEDLNV